ncbi:substrate-binding domain-containing protein [Paraburkholderia hospita]|jgi:ribose transport system substrate-binding protein|uniref:Sugar ABC transporter substrate-binding protein n=1 Tax=Paraburkholderia hospita TaxID=169430 RepID=A0AAN1JE42_9BURK|nr:substrate-binding domain-containing protein [Paraburkholderia hospita]SOE90396.1 monosaccharide ABC transporter substrate-binding protein, CUT2 family [Burkholderia sp. YR290]AUT71207.1 sugar ABC transporter substrate-binding protein [Paraburkholderia hospita]OUL89192.1 sugar ABC transporter substrate-binding protein [Paraburkholderia hospita]SEI27414.1 monosaccharide ABC transporter substrate-binding protein, CUT2 family [Paraburkholderia hospita]SKC93433.1 monosaccharide ABC transporter s
MNDRRVSGARLASVVAATALAICCSQAFAQACTSLPAKSIGPTGIVGQGPNGEKAASADAVKLTDAEAAKVKAGKFKVGISMQTMNLDWSQLQVAGITDTLKKYGVEVIGTASAEYQVDKQIADIENTIQRHPDGIISIPVDGTATAATYKKVSQAGIKLVFMDNVPTGLKHPEQYSAMVSADSEGNGQIAAKVLASCVPKGGTVGLVNFGVDYFSTTERTKAVNEWLKKNRPDIKVKQVAFTDPSKVGQIAGDFLTANPDVKGVFAVWDQPALDTLTSMRAQGINTPVTTVDLGLESAIEIAKGGPLKATGSQRPYDQGVAEAMAMMKALIGQTPPAWIGVQSLPVVQSNVLESYKTVFKKDPPPQLADACKKAAPACG